RASGDTDLMFLRSPAVRECAGKAADRDIGWGAAVGNGFDDARRHESERGEVADVALDLVLVSGDLLERVDPTFAEIVHPGARPGDGGQQHLACHRIEICLSRRLPGDALLSRRAGWHPGQVKRARDQRTGICGALPFRKSAAPERDVDMSR